MLDYDHDNDNDNERNRSRNRCAAALVGDNSMTIEQLTAFFGWAAVINVAVLVLSTGALLAMRGTITGVHARLFGLDETDLGRAYFQYLAQFKIATIVFSIAPYLALRIIA
jgi:hypothetical protein